MICPRCGHETDERYCGNCGMLLRREEREAGSCRSDGGPGWDGGGESGSEDLESRGWADLPRGEGEEPARREKKERKRAAAGTEKKASGSDRRRSRKEKKEELQRRQDGKELKRLLEEQKAREAERERIESRGRSRKRPEAEAEPNLGEKLGDLAKSGVTGTIIFSVRVMQIISSLLMAAMTVVAGTAFWEYREGLGSIRTMVGDRNYVLASYIGIAGAALFMGAVWCIWILTRRAAGGELRLKTYDTGRGFLPFLICLAAVFLVGYGRNWIPSGDEWRGISAAFQAVDENRVMLMTLGSLGVILSFVRKILKV